MLQQQVVDLFFQEKSELVSEYPFLEKWQIGFDSAKTRAGCCRLKEKKIVISHFHIENNSEQVILDTLLHEFAHAIAFELYHDAGHGAKWRLVAKKIGATPNSRGKFNLPEAPWVLVIVCKQKREVEKIASRYRKNKKIKYYELKGRVGTQGMLCYLSNREFKQFNSGELVFEELTFIQ